MNTSNCDEFDSEPVIRSDDSISENAEQNHNFMVPNKSFKNAAKFRQSVQEDIKNRLNSGNACDHSVQNLLSSCLLSKNLKTKIYKIIILSAVLYGCEIWSITFREEHRSMVFGNKLPGKISEPTRQEVVGHWKILHNEKLHNLYIPPNIIRAIKLKRMIWVGHVHTWDL
jgi:hypothetical protein